jgi:hypothetical protein
MAIAEGSGGVRLFDNTRPRAPRDRFLVRPRNWASALDVALIDDRVLIAAGRGGLLVYRWGPEEQPTYIGAFVADRAIDTVTPFGKLVIVSHGSTGMSIVDPMHADGPRWVSTIDLPRGFPVSDVTVDGNLAYIVSGRAGFGLVDLSEPTRPDVILPRKRPLRVTFPQSGLIED